MDNEELLLRLKKAVEMEKWAAELYENAIAAACDSESKNVFSGMRSACGEHARLLEEKIKDLQSKNKVCSSTESILSFAEAGTREEQGMRDYYRELSETVADTGLKAFFSSLAAQEAAHEKKVVELIEPLKKKA